MRRYGDGVAALESAYHGPPQLTPPRVFTSWTLDVPVLVTVLVVGGCYLAAVHLARKRGVSWPRRRTAALMAGGLGALVVATMSAVGVYQGVLFYVRAIQTVLLLLLVPLFIALSRPLSLVAAASPGSGSRLEAVIRSRPMRALTFPPVTSLLVVVTPFLYYFTSWYEAGLRSMTARELTYLVLFIPGFLFFWTLLRVDPVPKAYPYVVTLWVSGAEVIGDAVLGLAVLASPNLIAAGYYHALGRTWGPSLHTDQVFGGGALWILGDLVGLPFLAAQLILMIREDEREAARVDAELDGASGEPAVGQLAHSAAGPAVGAGQSAVGAARGIAGAGPGDGTAALAGGGATEPTAPTEPTERPWWESDPLFGSRFRPPEPP